MEPAFLSLDPAMDKCILILKAVGVTSPLWDGHQARLPHDGSLGSWTSVPVHAWLGPWR